MHNYKFSLSTALALLVFASSAQGAVPESCGTGSTSTQKTYQVNGSGIELLATPSASGAKLLNEKATAALKRPHYLAIDSSTTVIEECTRAGWSRVRVTEPEWLRATHQGWVPSNVLRGKIVDAGGVREFVEADFIWDSRTIPHKKVIIAGVNKVHRENARCKQIDPGSAYISKDRSTAADPVFFVTCGSGAGVFNAYFSRSEVSQDVKLSEKAHIGKARAISLCEARVKSQATHPSTVDFSRIMGTAVHEHPNGRTSVTTSFTAKNSYNLELKYNVRCLLDSSGLIEANLSEAGRK